MKYRQKIIAEQGPIGVESVKEVTRLRTTGLDEAIIVGALTS